MDSTPKIEGRTSGIEAELQHRSEFESHSRYCIHFQTNTLEKHINPLIPTARV